MTDPSDSIDSVLHGTSLRQYASVQAGLAEGIDLEIVLESEGVDPTSWLDADEAWSDRILEDFADAIGVLRGHREEDGLAGKLAAGVLHRGFPDFLPLFAERIAALVHSTAVSGPWGPVSVTNVLV